MKDRDDSRVVVLDRDGVLVIDKGYLGDPEGLEFTPTAPDALRLFTQHQFRIVVATNQSGVARGYFGLDRLEAMNRRLHAMVRSVDAELSGIYFCPHLPEAACGCRKPAIGMLSRAAEEVGFDPTRAYVIGDKPTDVEFGRRAGARTILIHDGSIVPVSAGHVFPNLLIAARYVVETVEL